MSIVRLAQPDDLDAVRELCRAYRALLADRGRATPAFVQTYYNDKTFEDLMARLPDMHARPDGAIFVGCVDGAVMGCGMTHRIDAQSCEIKRVFVSPKARGHGLAKGIFRAAMDQARADGYTRMVLDTMTELHEAIALYHALGFRPGRPFYDLDPQFTDIIRFFEIDL